jgi:pyruvate dehydrogenase E1 component beta subunit
VGYGIMMGKALEAAKHLAAEGTEVEVIDLRTLAPLDIQTVGESVRKTNRLVTVCEAPVECSIASEVAATIQEDYFDYLDAPVTRVGGVAAPIPHSPPLIEALIPHVGDIEGAVRRVTAK